MKVLLILISLIGASAEACSYDTDCSIGSTCEKAEYAMYGVCKGGLNPGNSNDRTPVYKPLDLSKSHGNTCSYNTDCGIGSTCVKEDYALRGTCE